MAILNYTTQVAAARTIAEISTLLAIKGAQSITLHYDEQRRANAIAFKIEARGVPIAFQLPVNIDGVRKVLASKRTKGHGRNVTEEKSNKRAENVAWRIVKNWVEAQIAIIESGQAELAQVFMPYALQNDGRSMYELFVEGALKQQKQLGAGKR